MKDLFTKLFGKRVKVINDFLVTVYTCRQVGDSISAIFYDYDFSNENHVIELYFNNRPAEYISDKDIKNVFKKLKAFGLYNFKQVKEAR